MRLAVMARVMASSRLVTVERYGNAIAEDREQRADRKRNRTHRPNVNPNGHAKGGGARRRDGPPEAGNDAHGEQERGRADGKALDPRRQAMQILFQTPEPGRMPVDPVTEQRRAHESECIDQGTLNRAEDRAVHDGKRVGYRKRRRRNDCKDRDRQRVSERPDRSDLVFDARLMTNDEVRECEGRNEKRECGCPSKETIQAMIVRGVITLLCGVALYASLFMLNKSRRAARGEIKGPSVVKTPRAHLFGVPNSLLGSLYYPGMAVAVWVVRGSIPELVLLIVAFGAAATSAYLAYSLIYVTRRECPYCWTAHIVNWCLLALCTYLFLPDILNRGI